MTAPSTVCARISYIRPIMADCLDITSFCRGVSSSLLGAELAASSNAMKDMQSATSSASGWGTTGEGDQMGQVVFMPRLPRSACDAVDVVVALVMGHSMVWVRAACEVRTRLRPVFFDAIKS